MSSILLQVEGLTIVSDEGVIIDHLSFAVDKSEIIALTGKSGSGKTTIGLAILGMLPDGLHWKEGSIIWHGERSDSIQIPRDSVKWSTLRGREIAYIQQDVFGIFDPVLRIGKQMTMIVRELSGKPTKDIDTALRSTMKEVGISEIDRVWNSFPHQLSGGQLQRCQICLAIVMQPELIIADEPTSAIDKIHQVEILDLLIHMRNQYQIAILCITHEESVVNYLADRIIPLNTTEEKNTERKDQNILRDGMPEMPVLNVEHLGFTHQYGGLFSKEGAKIKDINFRLHAGHCMGIMGESGSGKSTLAQLLVGLLIPTKGNISINGRKIDCMSSKDIRFLRSNIQLVMQDGRGSLHPNKTIRWLLQEVVDEATKHDKEWQIDIPKILNDVGLNDQVLDRKQDSLSGGECLRISIARALLMKPAILICDESTTSLDAPTRDEIIRLLLYLMDQQKLGLILIAHDDSIIRWIAKDILVLEEGEIVEKGLANEVLNHPQHQVTKNILHAHATLMEKRNP